MNKRSHKMDKVAEVDCVMTSKDSVRAEETSQSSGGKHFQKTQLSACHTRWSPADLEAQEHVTMAHSSFPERQLYTPFSHLSTKLLAKIRNEAGACRNAFEVRLSEIPNAGYGLFARKAFHKGSILCKYDGSVKVAEMVPSDQKSHCLSLRWCGYVLDGTPVASAISEAIEKSHLSPIQSGTAVSSVSLENSIGQRLEMKLSEIGLGCMINHKKRNCASAQFILVRTHSDDLYPPDVFLQALRDVKCGEELFACYGTFESKLWDKYV